MSRVNVKKLSAIPASAHCTEGFSLGRSCQRELTDEGACWRKCKQHPMLRFPHPSRCGSTPSPVWEKAFIVVRFSRNLASLRDYRHPPCLIIAPNHAPVAANSAAGREGVRSTAKGESRKRAEESLLSSGRFRLSPATGRKTAAPPSSFISLTFTSQTGSLLLSLYAPRYCLTASAGFGRQFAKLRALSRLRRRYDARK